MLSDLLVQYNPDGSLVYTNPYQITQQLFGRQPFNYVELELDFCANVAGVAPCTAIDTGNAKCFNTFASCNDTANFNKTTKIYRFCSPNGARVPVGLDAIPCLKSISLSPAQIDAKNGMGLRASCDIRLQDFPHDDIRIDPYVNDRTYIPINQGTYFGKLKARNPFYNARIMRVYTGFLNTDGSFSANKFERRTFVIEAWDGLDALGVTRIMGKDVLKLASDERAVCPIPSQGRLNLDMTAIATSFTVTPSGVGADYAASGYVRIGSEVMSYTRSGDVFTVVRGQRNTTAATHKQLDSVQLCKEFAGQTSQNIVYDLLTNFANVSTSYIDKSAWDAEQVGYLPRLYNALITTPTGVSKLITELSEQVGFFLYWDEVLEKIVFRAIRPNSGSEQITALTSEYNLLADSLKLKDIVDDRVNEVWVYYGVLDPSKNLSDDANYSNLYVASNVADQSDVQNRDIRIKKILSRWITGRTAAIELGQRYLERFALAPVEADFMLDAKDSNLKLCDFVTIESKQKQDFTGSPLELLLQITKRVEKQTGTTWAFVARQFAFSTQTFSNRTVDIDGSDTSLLFDLDLKAAHDKIYDPASLVAGSIVEVIIRTGVLISASNTSNYALTNPNTWPSGVFVRLIIESGAIVAGRGGDGGDGGDGYDTGLGGWFSSVGNGDDGDDGGVAIFTNYLISIDNFGIITGGGGGGGGGGAVVLRTDHYGSTSMTDYSFTGGGGGGGWPLGNGGAKGDGGLVTWVYQGTDGNNAGISFGDGGIGGQSVSIGETGYIGGDGGDGGKYATLATAGTNGDNSAGTEDGITYTGTGGANGALGDAIHGNSFITWTATGTIYGAII
jgi:hypothetical protein